MHFKGRKLNAKLAGSNPVFLGSNPSAPANTKEGWARARQAVPKTVGAPTLLWVQLPHLPPKEMMSDECGMMNDEAVDSRQ